MRAVDLSFHLDHSLLAVLVHVEAFERAVLILDLDETRAGFDEPPRQQQAVAETIAVVIAFVEQFFGFIFWLVRLTSLGLFFFRDNRTLVSPANPSSRARRPSTFR